MNKIDPQAALFQQKINEYIAQREKFDPVAAYEQLKDSYPVTLRVEPDGECEIFVLAGESSAGRCEVYDNGLDIIFDINKPDGTYTHWHPNDVNEAIKAVCEFMEGRLSRG